jgi:hypothetical protein
MSFVFNPCLILIISMISFDVTGGREIFGK